MSPRTAGDTQPDQDSVVSGGKGSHGLMGIIQTRWGFESYWMIQTCICLGRMGGFIFSQDSSLQSHFLVFK